MIILDTHIWLWWIRHPEKLSDYASKTIEKATKEKGIVISSISTWEVSLLVNRGRLKLPIDVREWVRKTEGLPFVRFIPVDNAIGLHSVALPDSFKTDLAGRIITATAITMDIPLVTRDEKILNYPHVKTIWEK
jgi:PIN domain nuclease of toxin-antitoxin system